MLMFIFSKKLDSDKGIAQREASVFAKTLVAEYQTKKYSELKEPSKSLALRRLGHYRSYKEEQMAGSVVRIHIFCTYMIC
jgi:hypothetical protein